VCAWVVDLELICFYSCIFFMAMSRCWGYKNVAISFKTKHESSVVPRIYYVTCGFFSMVISFRRQKDYSLSSFRRLIKFSRTLLGSIEFDLLLFFSSGTFKVLSRFGLPV
jgi:hypothetical protein